MIPERPLPPWFLPANFLGLAALLFTWWRGAGGLFLLFAFFILLAGGEAACRFLRAPRATPYLGMLLAPLLLLNYSSVGDFRIRLACFVMLLYALVVPWRQPDGRPRIVLPVLSPGRAFLLAWLLFSLSAAAFHAQGIHLSGDEPHYVMIAQSLVEDGDLDLKNNLENKTYFKYLPAEIRLHGIVRDGQYRTFHMPGVSFLLVPFYFLFNLLGGWIPAGLFFRLCAALINAFFALGLFQVLRTRLPEKQGSGLFLFFLATFPLAFHAVHLYPELPAAALLVFAYLNGREKRRLFLAGLLLACLPWLHLKFVIPTAILALFIMAAVLRRGGRLGETLKPLAVFLSAPAVSFLLLLLYSRTLYGAFNPAAISPETNFFAIPLALKIETLLSFFLDQRDGLLIYAPLFLLVVLVFKKEIRRQIRDFALLAAIFLSYVLFHAYTTVRGAYSPAARPTLFVAWIMIVFLAAYYQQAGRGPRILFKFLGGLGVFASVWLFYYPLFLYQPVTREVGQRASALLLFLGSQAVDLARVFPSFLKKPNGAYLPNWIWLGALALALASHYSGLSWPLLKKPARVLYGLIGLLIVAAVCLVPHVHLKTRYSAAGLSFFSNSRNFSFRNELSGFKMLSGQDYDLFIDLKGSAAGSLDLRFSNSGNADLNIRNGKRLLLAKKRAPEFRWRATLGELEKFTLGKRTLVHLGIESKAYQKNDFILLRLD